MISKQLLWIFVMLLATASVRAADAATSKAALEILRTNCAQCHSQKIAMSGLALDTREAAIKGGSRGPSIVVGESATSKLIEAVERKGKVMMPPNKSLTADEIDVLRRWIDQGASWSDEAAGKISPQPTWWAFQKVVRPKVPAGNRAWAINEVDAFVAQKLASENLKPSERASGATLVRRAYMDLLGLPPTAVQVKEYLDDKSPDAWKNLVNKLLDSPHYGEKWGRHWLDLVRYGDTAGFELDPYIQDAWRYRDWVINSFNNDKPYDLFIREQIAADELMPEDAVARTGTGMYCVGPNRDLFPDQADINREETLTDYVDTTSAVFLGLTAGCARCHDHKFDPISQEDYFRIQAIFAPSVKVDVALDRLGSLGHITGENNREWKLRELGDQMRAVRSACEEKIQKANLEALPPEARMALEIEEAQRTPQQKQLVSQYRRQLRVNDDDVFSCLNSEHSSSFVQIQKQLFRMFSGYKPKPFACGIEDMWNVSPKTFMPVKGNPVGKEIEPGFFSILGGGEVPPPTEHRETTGPIPLMPTTGRRTALANWISAPDNPLTGRVMVNRIWQYHFGRGLIATASDFGTRSGKPSHPALLDWLSAEFVSNGWSIKHMHRLIMNSATYQQSSVPTKTAAEKDPLNIFLSHFSRRRVSAEELRDSILLTTGGLNLKQSGRPVVPPLSPEEKATLTQPPENAWVLTADHSEHNRRSIYMIQKRTFRMPMLEVFDAPESMLTCSRREASTTAPQSLSLLNGSFTMNRANSLASQLDAEYPQDNAKVIQGAWLKVLSREPSVSEMNRSLSFLKLQSVDAGGRHQAIVELNRALLNLNEFLYVD